MSVSMTTTVQITDDERQLLLELLNSAEEEAIQGLDHTDTRSFRKVLRHKLDRLESLRRKLQQSAA